MAQLKAAFSAEYLPDWQPSQRFRPSEDAYLPARQSEHEGDEGFSENLPTSHITHWEEAAELYLPAAQASQLVLPSSLWCVPASHSVQAEAPSASLNLPATHFLQEDCAGLSW